MSTLNPENYYIPRRHRIPGQTTKHHEATLSPKKVEKIREFESYPICL